MDCGIQKRELGHTLVDVKRQRTSRQGIQGVLARRHGARGRDDHVVQRHEAFRLAELFEPGLYASLVRSWGIDTRGAKPRKGSLGVNVKLADARFCEAGG